MWQRRRASRVPAWWYSSARQKVPPARPGWRCTTDPGSLVGEAEGQVGHPVVRVRLDRGIGVVELDPATPVLATGSLFAVERQALFVRPVEVSGDGADQPGWCAVVGCPDEAPGRHSPQMTSPSPSIGPSVAMPTSTSRFAAMSITLYRKNGGPAGVWPCATSQPMTSEIRPATVLIVSMVTVACTETQEMAGRSTMVGSSLMPPVDRAWRASPDGGQVGSGEARPPPQPIS